MRPHKTYLIVLMDALMAALSFIAALYLRLGTDKFYQAEPYLLKGTLLFTVIAVLMFLMFRLPQRVWRYASVQDLISITQAVSLAVLLFLPSMFLVNRLEGVPRSYIFIQWLLLIMLLGGPRLAYRLMQEGSLTLLSGSELIGQANRIPVLLYGLNEHTELFIRETFNNRQSQYRVVGIVDDDKTKKGREIRGVKIYGGFQDIARIVRKLRSRDDAPHKIIVADTYDKALIREIVSKADKMGMRVGVLPRLADVRGAATDKLQVKMVAVEDLLGRAQAALDRDLMESHIRGKKILVTGAGGTIGSELVRQICSYQPAEITLFENAEHNLYLIDKELEERFPEIKRSAVIGDVRNFTFLQKLFKAKKPDVVFHAAALKHVPMAEINSIETAHTNIIGTKYVADACLKCGVKQMVAISTDKAVNPCNVMGATKRAAERYVQALGQSKKKVTTQYITVRFGNVLGSTGSVVPLFRRQLEQGGPLTVTHPDMVRYFMTVREAVELVLQAAAMSAKGSYNGNIFVLDMGDPVHIKDLALQMIRLAGLKPDEDIKITFTGLRPGEKLYEELFYTFEAPEHTTYDGLMLARSQKYNLKKIEQAIASLHQAIDARDEKTVAAQIASLAPEYTKG
ncbi:MAG: polysaccharide biosynthesis protein [Proteobacteria bacterium]|nr:polysaccharide biosynthesis protein [Pseudomonadota bacterium]